MLSGQRPLCAAASSPPANALRVERAEFRVLRISPLDDVKSQIPATTLGTAVRPPLLCSSSALPSHLRSPSIWGQPAPGARPDRQRLVCPPLPRHPLLPAPPPRPTSGHPAFLAVLSLADTEFVLGSPSHPQRENHRGLDLGGDCPVSNCPPSLPPWGLPGRPPGPKLRLSGGMSGWAGGWGFPSH